MSRKSNSKNLLLIIDPQNDFHEGGSLPVKGALADSARIAGLINTIKFDNIVVTMDTHQYVDIGHPMWWTDEKEQNQPKDFAIITYKDIENGLWKAARKEDREYTKNYVKKLELNGRFQHTIWPYHCIVGTQGHGITPAISNALEKWARENRQLVSFMWKGTNPRAEMYSAFKADVEVDGADETKLNKQVLDRLFPYDKIIVCGEASSHCVYNSIVDMIDYYDTKNANTGKKPEIIILLDCCSPVTGYEKSAKENFRLLGKRCKYLSFMNSTDLKI